MRPLLAKYRRVHAPMCHRPTSWFSRSGPRKTSSTALEGVKAYSDERVPPGRILEVDVFLRDGSTVTALVEVDACEALPEGAPARFDVALRFVQMDLADVERLRSVME